MCSCDRYHPTPPKLPLTLPSPRLTTANTNIRPWWRTALCAVPANVPSRTRGHRRHHLAPRGRPPSPDGPPLSTLEDTAVAAGTEGQPAAPGEAAETRLRRGTRRRGLPQAPGPDQRHF